MDSNVMSSRGVREQQRRYGIAEERSRRDKSAKGHQSFTGDRSIS
jgi:hypothetical protein